jgi:trypsin
MLRQGEPARRRLVTTLAGAALALGLIGASPAAGAGPRIVGGSPTTIEEWPWQVAIAADPDSFAGNGFQRQFCGGSLVAPNIVLSAAHCFHDVFDSNGDFDDPDLFSVITGQTTLSSDVGEEIAVSNLFVAVDAGGTPIYEAAGDPTPSGPALFDDFTFEWDAVFVTLAANSTSTPIKVAGPDETALWEAGRDAVATGWGTTS